ncbi:MAG: hypothetical protein GF364_13345 [Candidatus Lokiarchaeota archaeon]|nr:hypothetical protein [Candidatus Lokiarchaeota archaeon]
MNGESKESQVKKKESTENPDNKITDQDNKITNNGKEIAENDVEEHQQLIKPNRLREFKYVKEFRQVSIKLFKIAILFLIIFSFFYFIKVSIQGLITKTCDPWSALFDSLMGIAVISILILAYMAAHTRIGCLLTLIGFAYWWMVPCNWIINEWQDFQYANQGTYFTMWTIFIILAIIAGLAVINFLVETLYLKLTKRSIFWGPWFTDIKDIGTIKQAFTLKKFSREQRERVKRGVIAFLIAIGLATPGILPYLDAYPVKVKITPKDYNITFNFWAHPNMTADYRDDERTYEWYENYGFGPRYYTEEALWQFNNHSVNLDLTFGTFNESDVDLLKEWENRCPNITYRIVLAPSDNTNLSSIVPKIITTTELMIEYRQNGTLSGWRGFCFDIEGEIFTFHSSFESFEEAVGMWNTVFDYVESRSEDIGMTIEMECVSDPWTCKDIPFDGDPDIQVERGFNSYYPLRFTTYAPMIYRCWYQGDTPWGSEMDFSDPWSTSYEVYSRLLMLNNTIPAGTLGFYIGITNTSCYGRDRTQYEPYDWPDGENTGLYNLMRDTLIAKHFGMEEITFFLAWTWLENEHSMGGVFESYGEDFLDVMNETVNTNPPEEFHVYYNHGDAEVTENLRYDWVYDCMRLEGILRFILFWFIASMFVIYEKQILKLLEKVFKKKKANKTREMAKP